MIAVILLTLCFTPFAAADPLGHLCGVTGGGYTAVSTYGANLELLSAALRKNASSTPITLFTKGSVGIAPDTVYGVALCHGDAATNASACADCVGAAFRDAQELCVLMKTARVLRETCILSYSSHDFISYGSNATKSLLVLIGHDDIKPMSGPAPDTLRGENASDVVESLLDETARMAAYTTARYATGRVEVNSTGALPAVIYSSAQCNPDMPPDDCGSCLHGIKNKFVETYPESISRQGAWAVAACCNFRYGTHLFYQGQPMYVRTTDSSGVVQTTTRTTNTTASPPAPVFVPTKIYKKREMKILVNAIIVPLLATLFCFTVCLAFMRANKKGKANFPEKTNVNVLKDEQVWGLEGSNSYFTFFDLSQISDATNNFLDANKLGQGGFGPVYKGQFPDGREIAVKRLASHSGQGFMEFKNEVQLIAKLQHTNLVRLLGCCSQRGEKMVIYEYLPNKSLDFFIFDEAKRVVLNWNKRLAIIEGISQGLLYLHKLSRLRVIHRDLKASNILLDNEMNPKISDFGLAKIFNSNDVEGNTEKIAGTYGYMAPEYASAGIFSIKSDVFSFGVLILEIISGTRNSGFQQHGKFFNLLRHAWKLWKEHRWIELIDPSLVSEISTTEAMRCVNIGLICVQENADDRPTMSDVVSMLSSESITLPEPNYPAYFHIRVTEEVALVVPGPSSINDMTISILCGR
ncbi:cysteine-rich receptor-like protein kinase 10 isoform X1 [Lolium rigidum]|uniref:cysteine-rich receptor-like protein kinase 10 isoform X1 n=2 Tax=Lolium rigidum TaxID=89674 RepID=UPI001F5D82F8|nr:cysteine-rich receptor-like protein kinase 10 isoform X1 [Lolium rigidum]